MKFFIDAHAILYRGASAARALLCFYVFVEKSKKKKLELIRIQKHATQLLLLA